MWNTKIDSCLIQSNRNVTFKFFWLMQLVIIIIFVCAKFPVFIISSNLLDQALIIEICVLYIWYIYNIAYINILCAYINIYIYICASLAKILYDSDEVEANPSTCNKSMMFILSFKKNSQSIPISKWGLEKGTLDRWVVYFLSIQTWIMITYLLQWLKITISSILKSANSQ